MDTEEQIIVFSADGSFVIDENTTFVDEDGNPITIDRTELGRNEYMIEMPDINKKELDVNKVPEFNTINMALEKSVDVNAQAENILMEHDGESAVDHSVSLVSDVTRSLTVEFQNVSQSSEDVTKPNAVSSLQKLSISTSKQDNISTVPSESNIASGDVSMNEDQSDKSMEDGKVNVNQAISEEVKVDKNTCPHCLQKFRVKELGKHIRNEHHIVTSRVGFFIRCLECNLSFMFITKLREHLQSIHNMNMAEEEFTLPNMNAFTKWKHDIELKNLLFFKRKRVEREVVDGAVMQKIYFICHRSGISESKVALGKKPMKRLPNARGTCKSGVICTASIYCEERLNEVFVRYFPHHYGHGKDKPTVQPSRKKQNAIQEDASEDIFSEASPDDVETSLDAHQMMLLKKKDRKFIMNAFDAEVCNPGLSDAESVNKWVRLCCEMEDSPILFYQQDMISKNEEFMLIIMTEFQRHILLTSDKQVITLDSIPRQKKARFFLSYILVIDDCKKAFPVAFCISNKRNKDVLKQFLFSILESTGPLSFTYFLSDCEDFYYEAWQEVISQESKWVYSFWHTDSRIREHIRRLKKSLPLKDELFLTFKMLQNCQNPSEFESKYYSFITTLQSDLASKNLAKFFIEIFEPHKERWAKCFLTDIKMNTIINLESLYRILLCSCTEGRKTRLDKFLFVIIKLVRFKMLGRLMSTLDNEKISLAIDAIDICHKKGLEIPGNHISSLSDKIWLVKSDDEKDHFYVTREFESCPEHCTLKCSECDICVHMFSCSCTHSMINANLCQHIHAVVWKFLTPNFSPSSSPTHNDNSEEIENIDSLYTPIDSSSELLASVLKQTHDVYKKIRSNKTNLSNESLNAISNYLSKCVDICSGKLVQKNQSISTDKIPEVLNSPFTERNNSLSQFAWMPNCVPTILPQEYLRSQHVLFLPNDANNHSFVQK